MIKLSINGRPTEVEEGTTVAAAILNACVTAFRLSVNGERRSAVCGMGICFECRVMIDEVPHQRSCNVLAREGMNIETDG